MTVFRLMVVAVVLSVAGVAHCQSERPTSRPARVMGELVRVERNDMVISAMGRGEIRLATDERTRFIVDFSPGKLEDLKAEMQISVTPGAVIAGRSGGITVVATSRGLPGKVVRIDGHNLVLRVPQGGNETREETVAFDEKTRVIVVGVGDGKLEDLKPETQVSVLPGTGLARQIVVVPSPRRGPVDPEFMQKRVMGTLTKVEGKALSVHGNRIGASVNAVEDFVIGVDVPAKFFVDAQPASIGDMRPDMTIFIDAIPGQAAGQDRLVVFATSPGLKGRVVRVDGDQLVLTVRQQGIDKEETVATDAKTQVIFPGVKSGPDTFAPPEFGKLSDLKARTRVTVMPESGTAQRIVVSVAKTEQR